MIDNFRITKEETQFLKESNAIEGVYDDESLNQAIYAWEYLKGEKNLTHGVILKTHKILMLNQQLMPNEKGYYRRREVMVGGRICPSWDGIIGLINMWLINVSTSLLIPGTNGKNIKFDHVSYEKIHPFLDGNGRTGRMFMNWQRLKVGLPILVIKESERHKYYEWFREQRSSKGEVRRSKSAPKGKITKDSELKKGAGKKS